MNIFPRTLFIYLFSILIFSTPTFAAEENGEKGNLPAPLEDSLTNLLRAVAPKIDPIPEELNTILTFVTENKKKPSAIFPEKRAQGLGIFYRERLQVPLRTLMDYTLNPAIPGEVLYPSSVRTNYWYPESPLLKESAALRTAPFPPAAPLFTRGLEHEETTPDTNSGAFYVYKLQRLFVLAPFQGRTAFFSISSMPSTSSVGNKGLVVGDDNDWTYVYTKEQGTNLALLGWAETYLYGSASVTVFLESAPGSDVTDMYVFKWARAGWSGMNVVKPVHITAGVERFVSALKTVLQSPKRPTPKAIIAQAAKYEGMDDAALRAELKPFADKLSVAKDNDLRSSPYKEVTENSTYADSLSRNHLINELMKQYIYQKIK